MKIFAPSRRVHTMVASLITALTIAACGGGGGASDTTVAPTGNNTASADGVSQGAITGFGSIIVNGVRYDDSKSSVTDDDDDDNPGRSKDDLRLGMVVTVSGSSGTATGTATAINFGSELKGPVQTLSASVSVSTTSSTSSTTSTTPTTPTTTPTAAAVQTLTILGQLVEINSRTVFDSFSLPGGYADIRVGNVLEIHGLLNVATNKLLATHIQRENNANKYKLTGNISNANAASKTFKIGSETIQYANIEAKRLRANIQDGATVRVTLATIPAATGTWNATRIVQNKRMVGNIGRLEFEGVITAFTSTTAFSIGNLQVDASGAQFPRGSAGLALGARVEVKGVMTNGVLVASRVKVEKNENSPDDNNNGNDNEIELYGALSGLNAASKTFTLRGLQVSYAGNVVYKDGSASNLANGVNVEVKAALASTGSTLQAQRIKFED
jgi:Domain of unknown function (DUF5666)